MACGVQGRSDANCNNRPEPRDLAVGMMQQHMIRVGPIIVA